MKSNNLTICESALMLLSWVSDPPACKYRARATMVATSVRA